MIGWFMCSFGAACLSKAGKACRYAALHLHGIVRSKQGRLGQVEFVTSCSGKVKYVPAGGFVWGMSRVGVDRTGAAEKAR